MPSLTESLGSTPASALASAPTAPAELPSADEAVAHTLLNCLLREVSAPEHQTAVTDGHLLLRLPRRGVLLRVALRRTSLLGAHRFAGPVSEETADGGWTEVGWRRLAEYTQDELSLRTGVHNEEFLEQIASSHRITVSAVRRERRTAGRVLPERDAVRGADSRPADGRRRLPRVRAVAGVRTPLPPHAQGPHRRTRTPGPPTRRRPARPSRCAISPYATH